MVRRRERRRALYDESRRASPSARPAIHAHWLVQPVTSLRRVPIRDRGGSQSPCTGLPPVTATRSRASMRGRLLGRDGSGEETPQQSTNSQPRPRVACRGKPPARDFMAQTLGRGVRNSMRERRRRIPLPGQRVGKMMRLRLVEFPRDRNSNSSPPLHGPDDGLDRPALPLLPAPGGAARTALHGDDHHGACCTVMWRGIWTSILPNIRSRCNWEAGAGRTRAMRASRRNGATTKSI